VRLVTPNGGLILDPFAGTGTVSEAALYEGMRSAAIELEPDSQNDFRRRMALVMAGPEERARAIMKARGLVEPFEETELRRAA
jgi:site-specific DNA-methyltransferase (adenine-specific)